MDEQLTGSFKRRLERARVPFSTILVFGSRARGDASPESDLDVLVVIDEPAPWIRRAIGDAAWEVGFDAGVVLAPVVVTRDEFECSPFSESMFVKNVLKDGIAI